MTVMKDSEYMTVAIKIQNMFKKKKKLHNIKNLRTLIQVSLDISDILMAEVVQQIACVATCSYDVSSIAFTNNCLINIMFFFLILFF